jgi:hypothetical protein
MRCAFSVLMTLAFLGMSREMRFAPKIMKLSFDEPRHSALQRPATGGRANP